MNLADTFNDDPRYEETDRPKKYGNDNTTYSSTWLYTQTYTKGSNPILYKMVVEQEWDQVKEYLEKNPNPDDEVLYYCDEGDWNILHWAIWNSADDKIQIRLIELGGKTLVHKQTKLHHFLPIHLFGSTLSVDVAEKMVEVGGSDILLAEDKQGNLPIYNARKFLSSYEVIDYFKKAKPGFKDNENFSRQVKQDFKRPAFLDQHLYHDIHELKYLYKQDNPFDTFDHIITIHKKCHENYLNTLGVAIRTIEWAKTLPADKKKHLIEGSPFMRSLWNRNSDREDRDDESSVLANEENPDKFFDHIIEIQRYNQRYMKETEKETMEWAKTLSRGKRDELFERSPFMKSLLNRNFRRVLPVVMLDLFMQILIVLYFSFFIQIPEMRQRAAILVITFSWTVNREINQLSNDTIKIYISQPSNWVDFSQVIILAIVISDWNNGKYVISHIITAIGVSWLRLLVSLGNFVFPLSVFVAAMVQIVKELLPFLFTAGLIVVMFAHMFRAMEQEIQDCDEAYQWLCNSGWNQSLGLSYFKTLIMFLTDDGWDFGNGYEMMSLLMILFAFITGILLLNVLIAVISNVFTEVFGNAEKAFWQNRLQLSEFSLFNYLNVYKLPCCAEPLKKVKKKMTNPVRIPFEKYPGWVKGHAILGESFFLYWFLYRMEKRPPLLERLRIFYQHAMWEEILFPSKTFERLLYGTHYDTEYLSMIEMWKRRVDWYGRSQKNEYLPPWVKILLSTFLVKCAVFVAFFIHMFCVVIAFILGFFSFGQLWPESMKAWLFDVPVDGKTEMKQLDDRVKTLEKLLLEKEQSYSSSKSETNRRSTESIEYLAG
mmetsp:Transcript_4877/g.9303  ORF Transcript_4877/g.9303 Transcript_4877/m.9303 type:complete len:826 (-) Transcript_4877:46-2523(-)